MSTTEHFEYEPLMSRENTDDIQQIHADLKNLAEKSANGGDNIISSNELWISSLALWTKMLQLAVKTTDADGTIFKQCSSMFRTIVEKMNIKELFASESLIAHKTFFTCLDLLNMPAIREYLLNNDQNNHTFNNFNDANIQSLLLLASSSCKYVSFNYIQLDNYIELLNVLRMKIEKEMSNDLIEQKHELDPIATRILGLFWNMADQIILIPLLLRTDLAASSLQWLANSTSLTSKSRRPLISIIHNIARHDDGSDELNKHNATEIVKTYQNTQEVKEDVKVSLLSSITLAELSTLDELKKHKKGMNDILNQLLQLTIDAANDKNYRAKIISFHVSELLAVLAKLFVVDERMMDYILVHAETEPPFDMTSTIKLFADLLINFSNSIAHEDPRNQFTCIAVLNIIWSISFQSQYQEDLKQNTQLIDTINNLANNDGSHLIDQYKPRTMQSMKKAADGILFNLNMHGCLNKLQTKEINASSVKSPLIMFSYSHSDSIFVRYIFNHFEQKKNDFKVWIDFENCTKGDPWELIADAIERADLIVCFISEFYKESKACRQEFTYTADDLRKPIVPILLNNYKPKGWLGIRKAGMNYIRFRDIKEPKQSEIENLSDRIRAELSNHTIPSPSIILNNTSISLQQEVSHGTKSSSHEEHQSITVLPPIDQWTLADIHRWFEHQHISIQLHDLYKFRSGAEMLEYAQDLMQNRIIHQQIYSRLFTKEYGGDELPPHQFIRFTRAMRQLLTENSIEYVLNKETVISPTNTLQTYNAHCVIL